MILVCIVYAVASRQLRREVFASTDRPTYRSKYSREAAAAGGVLPPLPALHNRC